MALLACTLSFTVHAGTSRSEEFPASGITLNFTPEFEETKGVIIPYGGTELWNGAGLYETDLIYLALDQEEYDSLPEDSFSGNNYAPLITIISADHGMTLDDISELISGPLDPALFRQICTVEDCTHFLYEDPALTLPEEADAVYLEEFEKLKSSVDTLLDNSEFGKPTDPTNSIIGSKIRFETTDTEGNPVKSEELFGSHEITMVNIWASWCGYCIDEMEELEAINGRLAEKDCAVVGLLSDGDEETALASGKETLKEKGVTYTNILPPGNFNDLFYITGYPTTYFVNREGIIVGTPIVGADIKRYEPAVEALLSDITAAGEDPLPDNTAAGEDLLPDSGSEVPEEHPLAAYVETNDDSVYRVLVKDEDGNPVPGTAVQFCSDTACMMGETDETGTVEFPEEKGHYTVHILEAPEEYLADDTEYTLEEFCDLTVYLFRK